MVAGGGVVESAASAAARDDARELVRAGVVEVERWRRKGEWGVAAVAPGAGDGRKRRRWRRHILERRRSGERGRVCEVCFCCLFCLGLNDQEQRQAPI